MGSVNDHMRAAFGADASPTKSLTDLALAFYAAMGEALEGQALIRQEDGTWAGGEAGGGAPGEHDHDDLYLDQFLREPTSAMGTLTSASTAVERTPDVSSSNDFTFEVGDDDVKIRLPKGGVDGVPVGGVGAIGQKRTLFFEGAIDGTDRTGFGFETASANPIDEKGAASIWPTEAGSEVVAVAWTRDDGDTWSLLHGTQPAVVNVDGDSGGTIYVSKTNVAPNPVAPVAGDIRIYKA